MEQQVTAVYSLAMYCETLFLNFLPEVRPHIQHLQSAISTVTQWPILEFINKTSGHINFVLFLLHHRTDVEEETTDTGRITTGISFTIT